MDSFSATTRIALDHAASVTPGHSANLSAIHAACQAMGGQMVLARALRVTPQAVNLWVASGRVPAQRVLAVEQASGVPRHALRPDLYPPDAHQPVPAHAQAAGMSVRNHSFNTK